MWCNAVIFVHGPITQDCWISINVYVTHKNSQSSEHWIITSMAHVSTASPSSTVFFLGGSVEFSNLSFSPELADPSSTQFQLRSQDLSPYVSIHTCIHNSCSVGFDVISLECSEPPESTLHWSMPLAGSDVKSARATPLVVRCALQRGPF